MVNLTITYYDEDFTISVKFKNRMDRLITPRELKSKIIDKLRRENCINEKMMYETLFCFHEAEGDWKLCETKIEEVVHDQPKKWLYVPTDRI